jgi:hypothetical protein
MALALESSEQNNTPLVLLQLPLELNKAIPEEAFKPGSTEEQYTVTVQAPNNAAKTNVADIKTVLSLRSVNHEIRSLVGQM